MWWKFLMTASAVLTLAFGPVTAEAKASRHADPTIVVKGKRQKAVAQPQKGGKAGFRIEREARLRDDGTAALVRLEPGFQLALRGDTLSTDKLMVAEVPLPQPVPREWQQALAIDRARPIEIQLAGKPVQQFWAPLKFRALFVPRDGRRMQVFDAPINVAGTGFLVLIAPDQASGLGEGSLLIVSNDGKWVLTSQGESVRSKTVAGMKLKKGRIPEEFYARFPSPLPPLRLYDRANAEGQAFFASLRSRFPDLALVYAKAYWGAPLWQDVLDTYTPLNSFGDRALSCTNMQLGGMDMATVGITLGLNVLGGVMNGVLSDNDCLAKRRGIRQARR